MDKIDLEELERLAAQATPGPWKHRTISKTATVILAADIPLCATTYSVNKDHDAAYIVAACNAVPSLIARVRELERRLAELTKENSGHKRVIHILENKVLALKGQSIPMEPRLPTCDALCRPRYILQSNCSNAAKEAGE